MTREEAKKHKKEIIAFIKGARIEYNSTSGVWLDVAYPSWDEDIAYRIKPLELKVGKKYELKHSCSFCSSTLGGLAAKWIFVGAIKVDCYVERNIFFARIGPENHYAMFTNEDVSSYATEIIEE